MRRALLSLCLALTFTAVFSASNSEVDDYDHAHHQPGYPVVIPNQRYERVHSAEVTEIGSLPAPTSSHRDPQWGGEHDHNDHNPASHGHHENQNGQKQQQLGVTGSWDMPTIQKYGFPPKCIDLYPKDDLPIQDTRCLYMVIITLTSHKVGREVQKYAHFKMSRKMDKPYGYVAVGLSKDDKMDDDHIVECVKPRDSVHPRMYHSWSNFHSMPSRLADNSNIIKNKTELYDAKTNILTCEFDRPLITMVEYVKGSGPVKRALFDLTKEKYKILMAVGEPAKPDSDVLGQHGPRKLGKVSIFDPEEFYYHRRSSASPSPLQSEELLTIFIMLSLCRYVML